MKHWQEKHAKLELHRIDDDEEDEEKLTAAREKIADADNEEQAEENAIAEASAIQEHSRTVELQEHSPDELRAMSKDTLKSEIAVYEEKLQKGSANLSVLEEYRKRENEFLARAHELEQTTTQRDQAKEAHDNLRKERFESFMHGFGIISAKLKEMYQTITLGGNAELELVDSLDPFSEGILFSVMPPKKSWKNISNLSGGEKTLSSLALVFALHAFKPTPLYAMDELDAALDFRNVSIVANLIKERTKGAQFIVISLRNNMFELASRLVGIYKTCGQTKSLAVHNTDLHAPPPQPTAARQMSVSRASQQPMTTPRMSVPPRAHGTTPAPGTSHRLGSIPPSSTHRAGLLITTPSTVRKMGIPSSVTTGHMMGPPLATPARFNIIPQTPRTGNIRGLGMTSTASSSIKLTSSQSIRGSLALAGNSDRNAFAAAPSTPLAMRRQLPN
jgi:structural maintenance of chromosome 4